MLARVTFREEALEVLAGEFCPMIGGSWGG